MLAMLSLAFCITVILGIVAFHYISLSTETALQKTVEPLASQAADTFDASVKNYADKFEAFINSSDFLSAHDNNERLQLLQKQFSDKTTEYSFAMYLPSGTMQNTTGGFCADVVSTDDIRLAYNRQNSVITDIQSIDDGIYFAIICPVTLESGTQILVASAINAEVINDIIAEISFGNEGTAYMVNDNGDVLLHHDLQTAVNHTNLIKKLEEDEDCQDYAALLKEAVSNRNGSGKFTYEGVEYIAGYANSQYFNGTLIVNSPLESFTGATTTALRNIILIAIGLFCVTIIISVVFAKTISKPIVSTTNRIRELAQGNLTDPVDVWYSKDEIGILSSSLEETIVCLRQYINLITVALTKISEGNLNHRMEGTFKGDFFAIKSTFNQILESLSETFSSINTSSEQVNSGAVQVSNSAQALSQGSTQQASAIEELSATLNDVSSQVKRNSEDAKNAYNIVIDNTEAINKCNDDMTNMLSAMEQIDTSSSEISNIIKVIDEIAFQTNILALNAAVEAAREGSKGFGVVADEVRRLASRSAEAAKQTASLIDKSTSAVSRGSKLAEQTARSLNEIVDGSNTIQGLVKNITDASAAQAEAIIQINTGVDQISAVVAANTSTAVGAASASEELSEQSLILKNMIAKFTLSGVEHVVAKKGRYEYDDSDFEEAPDEEPASAPASANSFVYPAEDDFEPDEKLKIVLDDEDDKY